MAGVFSEPPDPADFSVQRLSPWGSAELTRSHPSLTREAAGQLALPGSASEVRGLRSP